jgi:hypothetical protein
MPKDYLLIDMENLVPDSMPGLSEDQTVLIFTGSRQSRISRDLVLSTQPLGKRVEWIIIEGNGKNAADFHIAFYAGLYSAGEPDASFTILSKDTGFDPLVKHLALKGVKCRRIDDIGKFVKSRPASKPARGADEAALKLKSHFLKCGDRNRPKKISRLKGFVKNFGRLDDGQVNRTIEAMIEKKMIEVNQGKVSYLFA